MIKEIAKEEIGECVELIRISFATVAKEFHITEENAPRYGGFATTEERLLSQYEQKRPMIAYYNEIGKIIGYYSLNKGESGECELNNLCVLPEYRHKGIGTELVEDSFHRAKGLCFKKIRIGIIEENTVLKEWYSKQGFIHKDTKKFDFFPFTCGYMEKGL